MRTPTDKGTESGENKRRMPPVPVVHVPFGWLVPIKELEEGHFPDLESVAIGLRGNDAVPRIVREWLAEMIDQERIIRPKGAARRLNWLQRKFSGDEIRCMHAAHLEAVRAEVAADKAARKARKVRDISARRTWTPSEEAFERTRRELEKSGEAMSIDKVRDIVKRRGAWK